MDFKDYQDVWNQSQQPLGLRRHLGCDVRVMDREMFTTSDGVATLEEGQGWGWPAAMERLLAKYCFLTWSGI